MRIFLLEKHKKVNGAIREYFMSRGFWVDSFEDIQSAANSIDNGYNCFILEMNAISAQKSLELLKSIRFYYSKVPVLMLYFDESLDISLLKNAYTLGCDDVFKAPFCLEELEAKVNRLLNIRKDIVSFGPHGTFDFSSGVLKIGTLQRHFSTKEKRLLSVLFSYKGTVVTFETIQSMVWEGEYANVESIRSLMRRVRQKIPFTCIKTIINTGYILKLDQLQTISKRNSE